ncbi:MAG: hypothetical protein JXR23_11340 [Pontiellaceae bacterium]|nr:hypothetical protein [Pontiellaceae bacterium]
MKNGETRRIVPESIAAWAAMAILFSFELSVLLGGLEIKGADVERVAPWAYSLYSRLVGEHPDQVLNRIKRDDFNEEAAIKAVKTETESAPVFLLSPEDFSAEEPDAFEWPDLYEEEIDPVWPDLTPTNTPPMEEEPTEGQPAEEATIDDSPVVEPPVEEPAAIEDAPIVESPVEAPVIEEEPIVEPPVEEPPINEPVVEEPPERKVIPVG